MEDQVAPPCFWNEECLYLVYWYLETPHLSFERSSIARGQLGYELRVKISVERTQKRAASFPWRAPA